MGRPRAAPPPSRTRRGSPVASVTLAGGPFELFPPSSLEERLTGFRNTATGVELDTRPGPPADVPVVLKRHDGTFVQFVLRLPTPTLE